MSIYEFGPFALDAQRLLLLEGGEPVALGPKVVETLLALVEHPGDVLTKSALLDRIWPEGYVDEANLAQNVYVLRKVLRARWNVQAIETIPRRGYRFVAEVRGREELPPAKPLAPVAASAYRGRWQAVVAAALVLALIGGLAFAIARPRAAATGSRLSVEGARLYEIGRYYWNLRTRDGAAKSMQYFTRVIDTDPRNARGYAALASVDAIIGDYAYGPLPPKFYFERARAYARKALAIDPNSGEAYAVLGLIASIQIADSPKQMTEAVAELRRAIQIDPTSGPAHEWYGIALLELGHVNQAYAELRKASDLDPLSVATMVWLGDAARLERHYDAAIAYARETLDLSPQRREAYETLGLAYEALGERTRAIEAFQQLAGDCPQCRWQAAALLAEVYARTNRIDEARAELAMAQAHARDVAPADLAIALAAVGERSVALSILRRSRGDYLRAEIANDPRFAVLRNDPQVEQFEKPA